MQMWRHLLSFQVQFSSQSPTPRRVQWTRNRPPPPPQSPNARLYNAMILFNCMSLHCYARRESESKVQQVSPREQESGVKWLCGWSSLLSLALIFSPSFCGNKSPSELKVVMLADFGLFLLELLLLQSTRTSKLIVSTPNYSKKGEQYLLTEPGNMMASPQAKGNSMSSGSWVATSGGGGGGSGANLQQS